MEDKSRAYYNKLLSQYIDGTISNKDRFVLEKQALDDPFLFEALEGLQVSGPENMEAIGRLKNNIASKTALKKETRRVPLFNYGIAASLVLLLGAGMWFLNSNLDSKESVAMNTPTENAIPQSQKPTGSNQDSESDLVRESEESKPIASTTIVKTQKSNNQYDSPKAKISQVENEIGNSENTYTDETSQVTSGADNTAQAIAKDDLDIIVNSTANNKKSSSSSAESNITNDVRNESLQSEIVNPNPQSTPTEIPQEFSEEIVKSSKVIEQDAQTKTKKARINQNELALDRSEYINALNSDFIAAPAEGISELRKSIKLSPQKFKQEKPSSSNILIQFKINGAGVTSSFEVISGTDQECINNIIKKIQYGGKWVTIPANSSGKIQLLLSCS